MKNKNKITAFNIASTIILRGLAFFSGPIFSQVLGTNNYGIAAVYHTWVQIGSTVFSLQAAGTVAVARSNFPLEDQEKFQSSTLSLATLSYICFSLLTMIISLTVAKTFGLNILMIALGLAQGWGMYCVSFMNSKLTYEFKADKNFILSVITSGMTIGLSLILIHLFKQEENYWGRVIGQSSVYLIIGIILYIATIRKGKVLYNREYWKFTLPITIPTIFHLLSHIVLNQSDKVMLQSLTSNSAAGIYALASTFSVVLNTIWQALNNSWVPFYYEYTRLHQIEKMKRHARNYIELFTIVSIGFILLSREVFHLYAANRDFWDGTDLIPFLSVGFYFVFLYSFPVNFEFYNKRTKSIAIGTTSSAILNIILNYTMIKQWGVLGAVIATMVSHGFLFLFHYMNARRIPSFPFKIREFIPGLVAVLLSFTLYFFTKELWLIRWGIGAVAGVFLLVKIIKRKEIF